MRRLMWHWFYLLPASLRLAGSFLHAYWYWKTSAPADLDLPFGKTLDAAQTKRRKHYFYGTTYLSAVFCQLLGRRKRRLNEMRAFSNLATLACFFDDLTDNDQPGFFQANSPEQFGRLADKSGLALFFLNKTYAALPPERIAGFKQYLDRVFQVEIAGRQNRANQPGMVELEQLTAEKGACSVLLFRCLLPEPISETERQALAHFGSLIQLCDDIFDLWFDRQQGIVTIATRLAEQNDLEQLNQRFERQVAALNRAIQSSPGSAYRRETTICVLRFLVSITRVCLRHYFYLQKKHGTLPLNHRSEMVVDMGRWKHRCRVEAEVLKSKCKI